MLPNTFYAWIPVTRCSLNPESRFLNPASQVHLELLIPDLIAPGPAAAQGLALPALERLLGRALRTVEAPAGIDEWLSEAAGLSELLADGAPVPSAALSLLGDGGVPGSSSWLRADPGHLRVDRDQLLLDALPAATLSDADAAELVATLNAHFAANGLKFSATKAHTWYVETGT